MKKAVAVLLAAIVATSCATSTAPPPAATGSAAPSTTASAAPGASAALVSEQPDRTKYDEYLSDAYLGSMPVGKVIGTDGFPTKTTLFHTGSDQLCLMTQVKKTIPKGSVGSAVYDPAAKVDAQPRMVIPAEWPVGGSGGCGTLPPVGRYEYKLYIDNVVVAVLPFEVR